MHLQGSAVLRDTPSGDHTEITLTAIFWSVYDWKSLEHVYLIISIFFSFQIVISKIYEELNSFGEAEEWEPKETTGAFSLTRPRGVNACFLNLKWIFSTTIYIALGHLQPA